MKKVMKNLMATIALVLCLSLIIPIGIVGGNAKAASISAKESMTIDGFVTEVEVGDYYHIKKSDGATITVKDYYGKVIDENSTPALIKTELEANDFAKFLVASTTPFTITYSINGYKQTFTIRPTNAQSGNYFKFDENSSNIIPSKLANNNTKDITLPNPEIYDKEDELVKGVVYGQGTAGAGEKFVKIVVTDPKYNNLTLEKKDGLFFIPGTGLEQGIYTISYKYYVGNQFVASIDKQMRVLDPKNYKNDYKLSFDFDGSSSLGTLDTGVKITLPKVKGINAETKENVEVYYNVRAYLVDPNNSKVETDVSNEEFRDNTVIDGLDFTPNKNGTYKLKYEIKDFFGHVVETANITNVKVEDNKEPKPIIKDSETDKATFVRAKYNQTNIVIPAISGEDNFLELKDLILTRTILLNGTKIVYESSENCDKNLIFNATDDSLVTAKTIKAETTTDDKKLAPGSYEIRYTVQEKTGKSLSKRLTKEFTVATGAYDDAKAPVLGFKETFYKSYAKGDEIKFTPTVSDDVQGSTLPIKVEWKLSTDANYTELDPLKELEENAFEITKPFTIEIPKVTEATEVFIKITSTDFKNQEVFKEVKLAIRDTGVDGNIAIKSIESVTEETVNQGDEVTLPTIEYTEAKPEYMSVKAYVTHTITNPETQAVKETKMELTNGLVGEVTATGYKVSGAKFLASFAGSYKVSIVAQDGANKTLVSFFDFNATGSPVMEEARIDKLPAELNGGKSLEFGNSLTLPAEQVVHNYGSEYTYETTIKVVGTKNFEIKDYNFKPETSGTYKIQYVVNFSKNGVVESDKTISSKEFTLKVEDTIAPVVTNGDITDANGSTQFAKNTKITLPTLEFEDASDLDLEKSNITISSSRAGTTTINVTETNSAKYIYEFSKDGEYTIKYTAVDVYGNSSTKTYTMRVGDTNAPTIKVEDDTVAEKMDLNSTLKIAKDKVSVGDVEDKEVNLDDVKVTVINKTTNKEISAEVEGAWSWKIETAGTYEVTFEVKDSAGWTTTVTKTFVVDASNNNGIINTEVLGTVLIVIAVLVLAGVIVYFIVSSRRKDRKPKEKKAKDKNTKNK